MLFDLIVLGTDLAGLETARLAAELGQSVAVVEDPQHFETDHAGPLDPTWLENLDYFNGCTKFLAWDSLEIANSAKAEQVKAQKILLAVGTKAKRPLHVPFDGQRILSSDEVLKREGLPQNVLIVGAGEQGIRCAAELVRRGVKVSLVDQSPGAIPKGIPRRIHADWNVINEARCPISWGTAVLGVESRKSAVTVYYDNGSIETYGAVAFAVGRIGCTEPLQLPLPELLLDENFRVWCNERGQTGLSHIYAAGSVVGFPRFPGSPQEEAEHIIGHMLTEDGRPKPPAFLKGNVRASRHRVG